jgi:exopolyphosphatase/guanosine-5'-triphosphate,3'-diphosphate pyrophosphatase
MESSAAGFSEKKVLMRGAQVTRLGEGISESGSLSPPAQKRVLDALLRFTRQLEKTGGRWVGGVATSACRRAGNHESFFDTVEKLTLVRPRLLSGSEEAKLTYRGVKSSLADLPEGIIIDIGGGSTEVVFFNKSGLKETVSLEIGVVSLQEKCKSSQSYSREDKDKLAEEVNNFMTETSAYEAPLIVVGGTATTASAYLKGLDEYKPEVVHSSRITAAEIEELIEEFSHKNFVEIEENPVVSRGRGAVMLPGLYILRGFMSRYNRQEIIVSDCGILAGLLEEICSDDF